RRAFRSSRARPAASGRIASRRGDGVDRRAILPRQAAPPLVIHLERIVVQYPRANARAVNGVSLDAPRGTLTAVVGPNGSGKSTLVRALIGRVAITSGAIRVDGIDVSTIARDALARRVAVVTQREDLAFPLQVADYVALGRFPHLGVWRTATDRDRRAIADAMDLTGVTGFADR